MPLPASVRTRASAAKACLILLLLKATLTITIILGTLYEFVEADSKQDDQQYEIDCVAKGFVPSELNCNSCDSLKDFDLTDELFDECKNCCTQFDVVNKVCTFLYILLPTG